MPDLLLQGKGVQQKAAGDAAFVTSQDGLTQRFDLGSATTHYLGWAEVGSLTSNPVWKILRIQYDASGNPTTKMFADGDVEFDNIWDNRAGLSYS